MRFLNFVHQPTPSMYIQYVFAPGTDQARLRGDQDTAESKARYWAVRMEKDNQIPYGTVHPFYGNEQHG